MGWDGEMIDLNDKRRIFSNRNGRSNPYRIVALLALLMAGIFVIRGYQSGQVEALFLPTPTPTRIPRSYALEGETQFVAGNLPAAIAAYQRAMELDPTNARLIAELARIQTYYSSLSTTDAIRVERLQAARENIDKATELAPEDSFVRPFEPLFTTGTRYMQGKMHNVISMKPSNRSSVRCSLTVTMHLPTLTTRKS